VRLACRRRRRVTGPRLDPGGFGGYRELDSLAVDSAGNVCVGTLLGGGITVVAPDGTSELYSLPDGMADLLVTNICFGGDDLTTAYITLSQTGRLISCRWPRSGLRLAHQRITVLRKALGG
jgi:gluconolactonase